MRAGTIIRKLRRPVADPPYWRTSVTQWPIGELPPERAHECALCPSKAFGLDTGQRAEQRPDPLNPGKMGTILVPTEEAEREARWWWAVVHAPDAHPRELAAMQ